MDEALGSCRSKTEVFVVDFVVGEYAEGCVDQFFRSSKG